MALTDVQKYNHTENSTIINNATDLRNVLICLSSLGVIIKSANVTSHIIKICVEEFPSDVEQKDITQTEGSPYQKAFWNYVELYKKVN